MISSSSIARDLEILHRDFADSNLRTGDGEVINGFISEDEAVSEYNEASSQIHERRFILRSSEKYSLDEIILRGDDERYIVVRVDGDERAWRHHLRKSA